MSKWRKIEDLLIYSGKGITPKYVEESSIIVLNQKCIRNHKIDYSFSRFTNDTKKINPDKFIKKGDILFNSTGQGTAGRCAFVDWLPKDKRVITDSHILVLRIPNYFEAQCLSYSFHSIEKDIMSFMDGSTGQGELDKIRVFNLLTSLSENPKTQKQIAKVLSDLDAKIEINNKINQQLEAMAKTLYDYWFVQFDFPNPSLSSGQAGKPYKSSGGKMVFNEELKREIPEGWEVDSLSSWIKNDKSGDWGKESKQGNYVNKVSCIRGADLNGLNGKGTIKSPTRFILEKNSHKLLEIGDFIIEISGGSPVQSTGRMAFITKETLERFENPLICSNFCKAVTLKEEKALYNFAYEWNRLYDAGVLFGWEGKTSGIKNLLFESFVTNHKISIPDSKIIEQFYNKAKPIHSKIQTNLKENQKLSELRDWLLPMLMNGQVSVGEIAKEVEDLQVAAEPGLVYETKENDLSNLFPTLNYDFEIATVVWRTQQQLGKEFGKKYIQKTISNIQFLSTLPKIEKITFKEYFWGMFSESLEKAIQKKKFIKFKNTGFDREVVELNMKHLVTVAKWTKEDGYNKEFTDQVNQMLTIYEDSLIDKDMNRIELLNTVLECIKVLKTYDFTAIYNKMKRWEMKEDGYKFKADKFKQEETRLMVGLVKDLKRNSN